MKRNNEYLKISFEQIIDDCNEVIGNSSNGCYEMHKFYIAFFIPAVILFIASFVGLKICGIDDIRKISTTVLIYSFCLLSILVTAIVMSMHFRLYKRQKKYRNILNSVNFAYENIVRNNIDDFGKIQFDSIETYESIVAQKCDNEWKSNFYRKYSAGLLKDLLPYLICVFSIIALCIVLLLTFL